MSSVNDELGDEVGEAQAHFVAFCKGCRLIVADSYSSLGNELELKMTIFYGNLRSRHLPYADSRKDKSDEILCENELNLSKEGMDSGR